MPHADVLMLSRHQGRAFNLAGALGFLTDAGVAAADTLVGLQTFIQSINGHADQNNYKDRLKKAVLANQNEVTDSTVNALTTVAGLTALTQQGTNTTQSSLFLD